jgi:S1-C subfamily serine protease
MRRAVGLSDRAGVLVRAVEPESPAASAELSAGDLIVAANGRPVEQVDDLYQALDEASTSGPLDLTVVRGDIERSVNVFLAKAQA